MPLKKSRLSRNAIHVLFYLATLLVALVICLTYHLDRRYSANTRLLIRTHQLLMESERLYSLLKDCQRGYRGYLLTHDKALLEPYLRARQTLPGSLARVGTLTGPHAAQQRRLAALRVLAGQSLAHWDNVIRLHDQAGPGAALAVVKAGRGRQLVDQSFRIIAGFQAHERRLLTEQRARHEKSQWAYTRMQLVGGSVGLLLLSFSFVLLRGRLGQKEQWGRQLEAQVRERTGQLEASREALAEQARQLAAYNQRLEETVRERTGELEDKNRELAEGEEDLRAANEALLAANAQLEASVRTVERLSAEALHLSERQYRDLAESIPDPVVVYDRDLRYVLVNRALEKLIGLPAAQLLGKTSAEAFGEAPQATYRKREEACRQVMQTGVALRYEETIALDGKAYHADLAVYPTAKGGTFMIARDVTALVEARRQYQELADSITDPVVMVDGALRYRYVNKAFEQVAGQPAAALIGKTPLELFGEPHGQPAESARRTEAVRRVFRTRQPETLVSEVVHGAVRQTMEYALYPTASGNVLVITRDITARVEAEQQYRDLAESLTLPLVVYDRDLRYQYVNKAVEQLNGMPARDLLGKTGREVFGEAFTPREEVCRQVMETGRPVVYREHPVRDGKRHHWELAVYPTGRGGTLVLNHDITELVEARHQLHEQQEELKASFAALEASEGRLRRVLDSMFIFAGLLTTDGELLYTNSAPLNAVGVGLGDVLGRPFADTPWFHAGEERQKLKENLARAARGETVRYDTHTLDRDGNRLYLDLILGPLRNEEGEVVQIIGSGVDVTARHEAQTKLQQSNQRYQALLTNFPNGAVFLLDHALRYQVVGGAGLTEAGFTEQMLLGKTPQEVFPPEMAGRTVEKAGKTLAGQSLVYEETHAGRVYQVRTTPVVDEGGQVVAAMLMTQDVTKEREAAEGLRFYQFLVDHTEDPIYWINPQDNFRFSYVNRAACDHFGLPAEKLLTLSIPDWDPAFTWERCAEFNALIQEKKRMVFETRHRHASGEVIPVEISATLLFYKGQAYYAGYIKDLRERRRAEVALRESEQKFRSLFEANQDALFLLDVDSSAILDVNPTACQVYGYSREEMLSMQMTDLSAQPEQTARAPRLRVGKVSNRHHLRKDGTVFPVELSLTYYDQQGRQLCFVSSRDITERVQATRKLETEKQRLELALWGADLGMWDWHIPSGEVVRNERHERMLGYEPGGLASTADAWVESLHPDDLAATTRALSDYLEGKTDHYRTEHRLRSKAGDWIWMQGSGKVVERDADGKPLRMIGIQQDISEMKRSEESLRFYKYLIDNSPDPTYWIDPHNGFRFAYANEAACRHYGLSGPELLTRSIPDWDPTFTPERCQQHLAYMRTRRHKHFETVHRTAGGKEVPVEVSSFLLVYQGREYLAGYFRNIAERLEGARKLAEEKQRLELALNGADMGLWDWNVPTGEVLFSERCATMFGYGPGELRPHADAWTEMGHAEDTPRVTEHLQAHLDGRTALFRAEHRVRCKDGGWKWVLDSGKVIARDEAGRPLRMVGTCLDITTRKRAEGEIRKLATVAQKTDNAVIITDASGRIEWVNDGFTRISGYAFEEAIGHKPGALLQGPDTDPAAVGKMRDAVARREGVELEVLNYARDGKPYWLYLSIQPVFDDNGVLRQFIAIQTDITGRKKAEATILELNAGLEQKVEERTAQLQAVNKELEAFSYSVSHDLRSPLRSIDGFSKMLLKDYEDKLDEEGKDYLHTIRQATARMGHLIDDLLKLSKVSRTELNRFEVNLSGMAAQILGELGRETPERQVACEIMPDLVAHADHRLLHIALQNLLSNAWKYSSKKEAATIEVGRAATGRGEAYFVRDNGAGFDMRNADKLFGAFQRLHTTREFEGTGIGLAIVQRIILKHGGEIWAEAAPGQGATFFFTLPGA